MDFSNLNVLVIGDVCLNIVDSGISTRLAPESPVPVILNPTRTYFLGMAANVALNLHNLGANVAYTFCIGEDDNGKIFSDLLESQIGLDKEHKDNLKTRTTTKQRIMANNQQVARIDFEDKIDILKTETFIKTLQKRVDTGLYYDFIIISDYNKGIITKESWEIIEPLLWQLSKKFFVDTKKLNVLDFYEGMYIFPNTKEMDALLEYNNCKTRNELREEMYLDFIVETASEEGAFLYKDDGKVYHCPAFKSNLVDIYGAGDTFVAAFSLYYSKYDDKKAALGFANYCCSKVIQRKNCTPVHISEVMDFHNEGMKF